MSEDTLQSKLQKVQMELSVPKNQFNKFGGYNYRSCEDIIEAVKPLLKTHGLAMTISDDIKMIGSRVYVQARVFVQDVNSNSDMTTTAFAREPESQKGMNEAQITGSASSYARKYALNGMFCIDDTKDADATNTHDKDAKKEAELKMLTADALIAKIKKVDAVPHLTNIGTKYAPDYAKLSDADKKRVKEAKEVKRAELDGVL